METRLAAVNALNHIAEAVPLWFPEPPSSHKGPNSPGHPADFPSSPRSIEALDIEALIKSSNQLGGVAHTTMDQVPGTKLPDTGESSMGSDYLKTLGIDSTLMSKSESLSDVDVDDEFGEDVKMEHVSVGKRGPKTSTRPVGRPPRKVVPEEGPSRKKIKLESTPSASQEHGNGVVDNNAAEPSRQVRRPGRPKGSKSITSSPTLPSSRSGKTSTNTAKQDDMFQGLSGRQVMVLKRKLRMNSITLEQAAEEAMK